ncbi:MAG: hypothetical protein EVA89_18940 [Sandaracinaceae bacterium]|nr:MAG: hypothetical protein EVA89_18940 [Sandaracinaceae bacterium]
MTHVVPRGLVDGWQRDDAEGEPESEAPGRPEPDEPRPRAPETRAPETRTRDTLRPPAPGQVEHVSIPPPAGLRAVRARRPSSVPPPPRPSSVPPPRPVSSQPPRADRRSEGPGVKAERAVAKIDALGSSVPEPLPPDRDQQLEKLVREIAKAGPESAEPLRRRLNRFAGEGAAALARVFPGMLWVDLSRPHRPLRSAAHLSAAAGAMVALGDHAVPHVAGLLRASRTETRVAAALVAGDLVDGALVEPLAARLHDDHPAVRNAAMLALRASALLPEARQLHAELVFTLQDEQKKLEWRQRAAWTLGQLRDAESVPHLIEALGGESALAESARDALRRITGRDVGRYRFRWRSWWKRNGEAGRVRWLADALDQSDAKLRQRAAEELVLLTGRGFDRRHAATTREGAKELAAFFLTPPAQP